MNNKIMILALAAACAVSEALAVQGVLVKTDGAEMTGNISFRSRDKMYVIEGKNSSREVPLADVDRLDIAKPKELDRAIDQVKKGQGQSAIKALEAIIKEYKMLNWDAPAARYLVLAYLAANNPQKATEVAEAFIRDDKTAAFKGDFAPAYWQALLKTGKTTKLEDLLRKAAIAGGRVTSAEALLMRGDIIRSEGENAENWRKALTDGYLRVALMYRENECVEVRQAGLLKCAECFDKLGHAARAEDFRTQARMLK